MHRICRLHIGDLRWIRPGSLIPHRPLRPKIGNVAAANAAMPAFTKFTAAKKPNTMRSKMPKKKKCCRNKTINRITLAGIFPPSFQTSCFAKSPPKHAKNIQRLFGGKTYCYHVSALVKLLKTFKKTYDGQLLIYLQNAFLTTKCAFCFLFLEVTI